MLGTSELVRNRQADVFIGGFREVIARDFAAGIRQRIAVRIAEWKFQIGESGLFRGFAFRRIDRILAGLYQAFWKIPVLVRAQQEDSPAISRAANRNQS